MSYSYFLGFVLVFLMTGMAGGALLLLYVRSHRIPLRRFWRRLWGPPRHPVFLKPYAPENKPKKILQ